MLNIELKIIYEKKMIKFDFYGLTEKEKKDFKKLKTIDQVKKKANSNGMILLEKKYCIQLIKVKEK